MAGRKFHVGDADDDDNDGDFEQARYDEDDEDEDEEADEDDEEGAATSSAVAKVHAGKGEPSPWRRGSTATSNCFPVHPARTAQVVAFAFAAANGGIKGTTSEHSTVTPAMCCQASP
mmetsp:Transcript_62158/g.131313  ORF Transcript_62158/g.131313 Transcript_62158/m.131313 type:complete len:117 (+) Transcript_62158:428-778(+)